MHAFRIQVGNDPDLVLLIINELAFTIVALDNRLRTGQTSIERAGLNGVCVEDRGCG